MLLTAQIIAALQKRFLTVVSRSFPMEMYLSRNNEPALMYTRGVGYLIQLIRDMVLSYPSLILVIAVPLLICALYMSGEVDNSPG